MNKKIIGAIVIAIILIGIIVIGIFNLNSDLIYRDHKEIDINIGQQFDNEEIKDLVKEVVGNQKVIVKKVELYQDIVSITIDNISDEQLAELNTKINEKYKVTNEVKDIVVTNVSKMEGIDIIKPYILPFIISFVLIEIYLAVYLYIIKKSGKEEKEINILKEMLNLFLIVMGTELVYVAIVAITRIPANRLTLPIGIMLYIITVTAKFIKNK